MVIIRFDDSESEQRALDSLIGRFPFKTWANGDLMVPAEALAQAGIPLCISVLKNPSTKYLDYACRMSIGFYNTECHRGMHAEEHGGSVSMNLLPDMDSQYQKTTC